MRARVVLVAWTVSLGACGNVSNEPVGGPKEEEAPVGENATVSSEPASSAVGTPENESNAGSTSNTPSPVPPADPGEPVDSPEPAVPLEPPADGEPVLAPGDSVNGADGAPAPQGFAAVEGMGLATTTGGAGGPVVTVTVVEELIALLDSDETMTILVDGTFDLGSMVTLRSNKTLLGLPGARLVNGGLEMNGYQNIIVRNIAFVDGVDDTFKINQESHHIWVDHCDFTNSADGLFDITRQSSFITISWNHFYNHSKTMLIGHGDDETADIGTLKTTIHHNWFDGTEQRHPRVRFGEVHVFNNYFLANGLYGVASTMDADVVVEANFFENVAYPTYVGYDASGPGDLVERNNVYVGSGRPETQGEAFDPAGYYDYVPDDPAGLPALVRAKAGVGVIDPMALVQ